MGFFSKIITAFRGAASEAGDAIVDTQSMRILEQEMRCQKTSGRGQGRIDQSHCGTNGRRT